MPVSRNQHVDQRALLSVPLRPVDVMTLFLIGHLGYHGVIYYGIYAQLTIPILPVRVDDGP